MTTDLWTDPDQNPYMAVTAHWIEAVVVDTPNGPHYSLKLRVDLIGFLRVNGRHTGELLAHAFEYILDRLHITDKVYDHISLGRQLLTLRHKLNLFLFP